MLTLDVAINQHLGSTLNDADATLVEQMPEQLLEAEEYLDADAVLDMDEDERPQTASTVNASALRPSSNDSSRGACTETDHTLCEHRLLEISSPLAMETETDDEEDDSEEDEEDRAVEHQEKRERRMSVSSGFYSACSRVGSAISLASASLRSTMSMSGAERSRWYVWRRGESTPLDLSTGKVVLMPCDDEAARGKRNHRQDEVRIIGKGWEGLMGICDCNQEVVVSAAPSASPSTDEGEGCVRVAIKEIGEEMVMTLRAVSDSGTFVDDEDGQRDKKGTTILVFVIPVPMSLGEIGEMCKDGYVSAQ